MGKIKALSEKATNLLYELVFKKLTSNENGLDGNSCFDASEEWWGINSWSHNIQKDIEDTLIRKSLVAIPFGGYSIIPFLSGIRGFDELGCFPLIIEALATSKGPNGVIIASFETGKITVVFFEIPIRYETEFEFDMVEAENESSLPRK